MMGMTEVRDFKVNKGQKRATHQSFELEMENGEKLYFTISNELAYQLAHKLQKNVDRSEGGMPDSPNGRKYSQFYGMNY